MQNIINCYRVTKEHWVNIIWIADIKIQIYDDTDINRILKMNSELIYYLHYYLILISMISFIGKRLTNKFNIFYRKNLNSKAFSSHKLNYGQGGNC